MPKEKGFIIKTIEKRLVEYWVIAKDKDDAEYKFSKGEYEDSVDLESIDIEVESIEESKD